MSDEHTEGSSAETTPGSSDSATPSVSISSLETDLKSSGINDDFILLINFGLSMRPAVELDGKSDPKIDSKLSISHHGRLYGKMVITGRRPPHDKCILNEGSDSWRAFKSELQFISTHFCHWHSHPNIIRYHGLALLEKENGCVPYLLSEHVERNLLNLLEDKRTKLTHHDKVSIIQDIASGLSFLHSCRPRAIVHGALDSSSVLLVKKYNAKLTNFFHAGCVGDSLTVVSERHKPRNYSTEMKLETSLDMTALGYIIKAIDAEHKNREQVRGWRNVLEDYYVLYDSEDGPPEGLTSCEVSQRLADYLDNPNKKPQGEGAPVQQEGQPLSVSS